jgi:DNA-binding transcriptional regulator YbjK
MPLLKRDFPGEFLPADRLRESVLDILEKGGRAALSVRAIARHADVPASAVYYYHSDLEQLLSTAQSQAMDIMSLWCDDFLARLPSGSLPLAALPSIMTSMIDSVCTTRRREMFAWREAQLAAERHTASRPVLGAWEELWVRAWSRMLKRFGCAEHARATALFFDGESLLHLVQGRTSQDRACLEEICAGWACWLGGSLAPEGPWQTLMRRFVQEDESVPEPLQGVPARIAAAAADLVSRHGAAALTHRAVASMAGLSAGAVAYNFRTSESLFEVAFTELYRRLSLSLPEPSASTDAAVDSYRSGFNELVIAAARHKSFERFGPRLRYTRGRTSRRYIEAMVGPELSGSDLDAAIFSSWGTGMTRWCIGRSDAERDALRADAIRALEDLFERVRE